MRPGLAWLSMPKLEAVERTRELSVTLKLADEDAAVVGSILKAVGTLPDDSKEEKKYETWYFKVRGSHGHRSLDHLKEIAGAFQIAVRANQR